LTRKKRRERTTLKTGWNRRSDTTKEIKCQLNFDVKLRQVLNTLVSGDGVRFALQKNVFGVTLDTTNRTIGGVDLLVKTEPSKAQGNAQPNTTPNRNDRSIVVMKVISDAKRRLHSLGMRGELGSSHVIVSGDIHNKGFEGLDRHGELADVVFLFGDVNALSKRCSERKTNG